MRFLSSPKIIIAILLALAPLQAQAGRASKQGLFNHANMSTQTWIGIGAVLAVAAGILIYNGDHSHAH